MRQRQLFWTTVPALLLLILLVTVGEPLVQLSIPALRSVFEWVAPDFKVLRFELDREKADRWRSGHAWHGPQWGLGHACFACWPARLPPCFCFFWTPRWCWLPGSGTSWSMPMLRTVGNLCSSPAICCKGVDASPSA